MGHTKGPWRQCGNPRIIEPCDSADDWNIADCGGNPNGDDDGRLIAAAPELLNALQAIVFAARAAIAKATGKAGTP